MEKPLIDVLKERKKVNLLNKTLTAKKDNEVGIYLSEEYTNFDFIVCKVRSIEDSNAVQTVVLAVGISESSSISIVGSSPEDYAVYGRVFLSESLTESKIIRLKCNNVYGWSGLMIEKVYGIKY